MTKLRSSILILLMLAGLISVPSFALAQKTVSGLIPCGNVEVAPPGSTGPGGMVDPDEACGYEDLIALAQTVINFLIFGLAAPLAAIMFAYAGFLYVTNGGNESRIKEAHDIFLYVFWGLILALAAWLLV